MVERDFAATDPNQLWLADITEHPTGEGTLYLCAIKDVFSTRIVGHSMDARMTAELAMTALRNAIALRTPVATIVHSDRGSQSGRGSSSEHLALTGCAVRWAASERAPTTPPCSRSSPCSRRTS
jgi:putative transposase